MKRNLSRQSKRLSFPSYDRVWKLKFDNRRGIYVPTIKEINHHPGNDSIPIAQKSRSPSAGFPLKLLMNRKFNFLFRFRHNLP
jgi:hypothetical protein